MDFPPTASLPKCPYWGKLWRANAESQELEPDLLPSRICNSKSPDLGARGEFSAWEGGQPYRHSDPYTKQLALVYYLFNLICLKRTFHIL